MVNGIGECGHPLIMNHPGIALALYPKPPGVRRWPGKPVAETIAHCLQRFSA